jgi:hypothetical protein
MGCSGWVEFYRREAARALGIPLEPLKFVRMCAPPVRPGGYYVSGTNGRAGRYTPDPDGLIEDVHPEDIAALQRQGCVIINDPEDSPTSIARHVRCRMGAGGVNGVLHHRRGAWRVKTRWLEAGRGRVFKIPCYSWSRIPCSKSRLPRQLNCEKRVRRRHLSFVTMVADLHSGRNSLYFSLLARGNFSEAKIIGVGTPHHCFPPRGYIRDRLSG